MPIVARLFPVAVLERCATERCLPFRLPRDKYDNTRHRDSRVRPSREVPEIVSMASRVPDRCSRRETCRIRDNIHQCRYCCCYYFAVVAVARSDSTVVTSIH
eukprot:Lithocolla_globosa_v1_NODE_5710_length_1198_cov_2.957130.p2 type:complete len:102 gc:universal NODE_5710_length_1198_cov_2.957130:103-408(+)